MVLKRLGEKISTASAPWGAVTELSVLAMSFLTFVVVGDRLGPTQFGSLVALLATVALLGPLLTASPEHVLVARIAQGTPTGVAWSRAVSVLAIVGPLVALAMIPLSAIITPTVSIRAIVLFSVGEVILLGVARIAIRAHEARGNSKQGATVALMMLATRVLALAPIFLEESITLDDWAIFHVGGSAVAALLAQRTIGTGENTSFSFGLPSRDDYALGLPFALNAGPDGLLSSNDKIVLSASGLSFDAGIYGAAYRIAQIANLPTNAIVRTHYASYFKEENQTREASVANSKSILKKTAPAGLLSAFGILLVAPFATFLLGDDFADSVDALQLLAFLPILRSLSTPAADVLTGTGRQRTRITGTLLAGLLNLILNLAVIPRFGWPGAVVTTLIAEFALLGWIFWHVFGPGPATES